MSIRIYNTAPGGGSGGAGTLQQVLNAGHVASVAGGGDTIELDDGTNVNTETAAGVVISNGTSEASHGVSGFAAYAAPFGSAAAGVYRDNFYYLTDNAGNTFRVDFGTGTPVISYSITGGNKTVLIFAPPTSPNIEQRFKDLSGSIAIDPAVNSQAGTTYQFVLADAFNQVTGNNAATQTWTIPANATVPLPVGCIIDGLAIGAGKITVAAAAGVTLNSASGNFSSAQWVGFSLWQYAANSWVMIGNLIA
jgi:hypothetical protein